MVSYSSNYSAENISFELNNANMEDIIIIHSRNNITVAFAHCISSECQVSADVAAVVFRRQFGRPTTEPQILTICHLT